MGLITSTTTITDVLINTPEMNISGDFLINNSVFFVNGSSGYVGINTASPQNTLNVVGDINVTGTSYLGTMNLVGGNITSMWGFFTKLNTTYINITNIHSLDWTNVTITESQVSDLQSYILTSDEGNLNVNRSNFWDNYNTPEDIVYSDLYTNFWDANVDLGANNFLVDSNVLFVDSDNNRVGIGTVSPGAKLDVVGSAIFKGDSDNSVNNSGEFVYNTAGNYYEYYNSTDWVSVPTGTINYNGTLWSQSGTTIFYTAGKVGIGTTSPQLNLEVHSTFPRIRIQDSDATGATTRGFIELTDSNIATRWRIGSASGANLELRSNVAELHLGDVTSGSVMVLKDGKVGIGTTSPSYPLEIDGDVSGISLYTSANISATGYNTRTSVFDKKKNVWDYIKDADYYKDKDGKIKHKKFYGYVSYDINKTDYSKPVEKEQEFFNETSNKTEIQIITTYPHTKTITEKGVSLNAEIDVLRQGLAEIKICIEKSNSWEEYKKCVNKV